MKRVLAVFLVLMLALSMTACQSKEKENESIEIEFWHTHGETFGGPQMEEMINEFNANNGKGITVKTVLSASYTELMTNLQSALAAGTEPALSTVSYANLNYCALNFNYVSITDVIESYFPQDKDYLSAKYDKAVLDLGVAIDGKLFGLPYGVSIPIMYYNLDILEAAGCDTANLPTTWQEVREIAEAVVEKTDAQGLYIEIANNTYAIIPLFYQSGISEIYGIDSDGDGYRTNLNTDGAVEAWTFFQEMYQEGSAVYMTNNEALAAFMGGELAMNLTTSARLKTLEENVSNLDTGFNPTWEGRELAVCLGGNMLTIWGQTEAKQKAAWEFIKFLLEPENMAKFDNGTGYVPPTTDVTDDMYELLSNPLLGEVIGEKTYARPWISWPGTAGLQVDQHIVKFRDKVFNDNADVASELAELEKVINDLISED